MKIEPSDKAPKAALAGFTPLFGGAKIVLAETPKAVTPFGGLGSFIAYLQPPAAERRPRTFSMTKTFG